MRQFLLSHANGKGRYFCWPLSFSIGFSGDENLLPWEHYRIRVKLSNKNLASASVQKGKIELQLQICKKCEKYPSLSFLSISTVSTKEFESYCFLNFVSFRLMYYLPILNTKFFVKKTCKAHVFSRFFIHFDVTSHIDVKPKGDPSKSNNTPRNHQYRSDPA